MLPKILSRCVLALALFGAVGGTGRATPPGPSAPPAPEPRRIVTDMQADVPLDTFEERDLLSVTDVEVHLQPADLPGRPVRTCTCARCGETILDAREIESDGETLCRTCFEGKAYYRPRGGNGA